ncbi:MAG: FAD-dependent oxidoreductase, partial [Bacteriovoracaceae bacterium]|nr:FAD-dependent oxidoreductase [Bacteriovoracaceae bacterium]
MNTSPNNFFEVAIIGGGITGIGLLRDLSLHGVKTALIEKNSFASQTSSQTSKMLHGGIRYLKTLDFDLIAEALQEKEVWLKLLPEYCERKNFYFPLYKKNTPSPFTLNLGLSFYDLLSHFKNRHQMIGSKKLLSIFPTLASQHLLGAGVYSDAIMSDQKLALACLQDALHESCVSTFEHNFLQTVEPASKGFHLTLSSGKKISCAHLVFCTGPFTDKLLENFNFLNWKPRLSLSKGSHLWVSHKIFNMPHPLVLPVDNKRIVFAIPHKEAILLGTTEEKDETFSLEISPAEKIYLQSVWNSYFPAHPLHEEFIVGSFAGIRPLVSEGNKELGLVSRHHQVLRPHPLIHVILGGKYTTFRTMVQETAR